MIVNSYKNLPGNYTFSRICIDAPFRDEFVGNCISGQKQLFLIHDSARHVSTLDPFRDLGCLTRVTLHVGIPVTGLYVSECESVEVESNDLDLAVLTMTDSSCLECLNSTLCHTIVLCVDDIEILACSNCSFNDFSGLFKAPAISTSSIGDYVELSSFCGFEHSCTSAYLSCRTHLSANQNQIDLIKIKT